MIERKFVSEKVKEFQIKEFVGSVLRNAGQSEVKLKKTPLGEKIIISASKPGLVVGRKGENIKMLTAEMKKRFKLENPQIEIEEIMNPNLDAQVVADRVASSLERFGGGRFKMIGHRTLGDIMNAGALGAEITITGKIPSSRAKRWRFYQGYLKKSGHIAQAGVLKAYAVAALKTGIIGIQVSILPSSVVLPDRVELVKEAESVVEEKDASEEEVKEEVQKAEKEKKPVKKKATKKSASKEKEEDVAEQPVEAPAKTEETTEEGKEVEESKEE